MALSDAAGDTVQTYEYSVYGEVAVEDANHPNPYMFAGVRYDIEIGLYYNRARYYNPYTGRFLQTDPVGYKDGMNWYAYCHNNSINYTDPLGLDANDSNDHSYSDWLQEIEDLKSKVAILEGQYNDAVTATDEASFAVELQAIKYQQALVNFDKYKGAVRNDMITVLVGAAFVVGGGFTGQAGIIVAGGLAVLAGLFEEEKDQADFMSAAWGVAYEQLNLLHLINEFNRKFAEEQRILAELNKARAELIKKQWAGPPSQGPHAPE